MASELLKPEVLRAIEELPVFSLCLFVVFAQFLITLALMREVKRDLKSLIAVLIRIVERNRYGD